MIILYYKPASFRILPPNSRDIMSPVKGGMSLLRASSNFAFIVGFLYVSLRIVRTSALSGHKAFSYTHKPNIWKDI